MRTAEQILQAMIGQLFFQLAGQMAENEQLKAENEQLKAQAAVTAP